MRPEFRLRLQNSEFHFRLSTADFRLARSARYIARSGVAYSQIDLTGLVTMRVPLA